MLIKHLKWKGTKEETIFVLSVTHALRAVIQFQTTPGHLLWTEISYIMREREEIKGEKTKKKGNKSDGAFHYEDRHRKSFQTKSKPSLSLARTWDSSTISWYWTYVGFTLFFTSMSVLSDLLSLTSALSLDKGWVDFTTKQILLNKSNCWPSQVWVKHQLKKHRSRHEHRCVDEQNGPKILRLLWPLKRSL